MLSENHSDLREQPPFFFVLFCMIKNMAVEEIEPTEVFFLHDRNKKKKHPLTCDFLHENSTNCCLTLLPQSIRK